MTKRRVAILGAWHVHAREYAKELQRSPGIEVCCLWDDDMSRGRALAQELLVPYEPSLQSVMDDPGIDGVQVTSQTSRHPELLMAAAKAKKHIFTEKVLSIGATEGEAIARAVRDSGVLFAISFPHLFRPALIKAKELLDAGDIGRVSYARVRNVHDGSSAGWLPPHFYDAGDCGGGAMIDLGAHPMYTLLWLMGEPVSVQSLFTRVTGREVEDNAVSLLQFEGGAIGVSETGFVSHKNPYTLEISGDCGAILVRQATLSHLGKSTSGEWVEAALPEPGPTPLQQWAAALISDAPARAKMPGFGIEEALRLTRLMEKAYQAAK